MMIFRHLLALYFFHSNVGLTSAFSVRALTPTTASSVALRSLSLSSESSDSESSGDFDMFPPGTFQRLEPVQGGGTVKTFQMPPWTEQCQYTLTTNGRPMKCTVQLWVGPLRNVHTLNVDVQDGKKTPYTATLKFKKLAPTLKISTSDDLELPIQCDVFVPSPARSKELLANTESMWNSATIPDQKQLVQGGSTQIGGGGGSVRTWTVPDDVDAVQIISWSKDVGKKSFRTKIEMLQGPNNFKQYYKLQCGGGSQPYHGVLQTPGPGWIIRIKNDKFLEDGLFQFAVMPYKGDAPAAQMPSAASDDWWA